MNLPRPPAPLRIYLAGCVAFRFGLLCATYVISADRIRTSPAFDVVEQLAPLETFAWGFALLAVLAIGGAIWPSERPTRALLFVCFLAELLFGLALLFSWAWTPALAAFLPFAVADALVARMDYRRRSD